MFGMRKVALKALPLLLVAWTFFALMGGSLHAAEQGGVSSDSVVESALGVCAATAATLSVAALLRSGIGRLRAFAPARRLPPQTAGQAMPHPRAYSEPSPPATPTRILLQVIRA
jgi:hypothetical protein